jgi:CNT family concentrative nucleoside transporter
VGGRRDREGDRRFQSESPLVIRPYLAGLTQAQLFTVMTSGMAGVAGTILAAYASMGIKIDYLLAASFMSAPGGILLAKLMMPDAPPVQGVLPLNVPADEEDIHISEARISGPGPAALLPEGAPGEPLPDATHDEERPANIIMAAAQGAQTGVKLAVAVGAMVLAFVALVALANGLLGGVGNWFGYPDLSFQLILGKILAPVMLLLNVPWSEAQAAGGMFGTKVVLNEFVAFIELGQVQGQLSPVTVAVVTFALCGFANFSSIAIQMAVTGTLAPNQRPVIAKLGIKALIAGSLSNLMSAVLAGLLLSY